MDRGLFSVETISLLTCLKLRWPDRVQLIRGNHESRAVTQVRLSLTSIFPKRPSFNMDQTYGFYTECVRKYGGSHVWTYFTDMFDFLTLSVVIDDKIFCVHGGEDAVINTPYLASQFAASCRAIPFNTLHRPNQGSRSVSRCARALILQTGRGDSRHRRDPARRSHGRPRVVRS